MDGVGEWATTTFGAGRGNRIELTHEIRFPHSIGLLYSAFTYFTGFKVNSGEYKLMGLAPYGEPKYVDRIRDHLIDLKPDGSFRMDMSYFEYCQGLRMTSRRFDALFDGPPRRPEAPITEREMDIAASIQAVTEEAMLRAARHVHAETGLRKLCLAGGVALNCVGNGRVLREGPFDDVWIQPAAGDAGGALGVALFIWHQLLDNPRVGPDAGRAARIAPRAARDRTTDIRDVPRRGTGGDLPGVSRRRVALRRGGRPAGAGAGGRVVPGPHGVRAARARLAEHPRRRPQPAMQSVMNRKIKFRESFRPFAPSVLRERADEYFEMRSRKRTVRTCCWWRRCATSHRMPADGRMNGLRGLDKLKMARSDVPAVTHVDGSARVQTVDAGQHGRYAALLRAFEAKTGCPVLINTSFNVRGEPIVCTPEHAYRCFMATNMDVLVLERFVTPEGGADERRTDGRHRLSRRVRPGTDGDGPA